MKKISKILLIALSIILIKQITSFVINEIIIFNYNNTNYNSILVKTLYLFNFNQSYIAYYNEGNILYKTKKYDDAIEKYKKSLEKKPPKKRICDIRINLSLAMIKKIDSSDYRIIYNQLEEAKNNLYKNNCASAIDDNGYSQEAEKLEEEIKNLQDQLNGSSNNTQPNNKEEQQEEQEGYSDIEEELKKIEKESNASRQSDMTTYENMSDNSYYSGKRW